jgi:hypothetical protein
MNGKDLMGCWTEAGATPDATFLALPFLNAEQFANFYTCATKDLEKIDKKFILPTDGMLEPKKLLSVVLFGD